MRRSRGRRQRVQHHGVQRHRIASKFQVDNATRSPTWAKARRVLETLGQKCFAYYASACYFLCLVPLENDSGENQVKPASRWKRIVQVLVYSITFVTAVQKLASFVYLLHMHNGTLDFNSLLCFAGFWAQVVGLSASIGTVLQPNLTLQLINSWSNVINTLNEFNGERKISIFSNLPATMQVVISTIGTTFTIISLSLFGLYFSHVPMFALTALEQAGLFDITDSSLPRWVWLILFLPLDIFQFSVPFLPYKFCGDIIMLEIGLLKLIVNGMRRVETMTLESRQELERLYVILQVHNAQLSNWVKPVLIPVLSSIGGAIVLCLYFPIKHPELPSIINLVFLALASFLMSVVFWASFDAVTVIRSSEEVMGGLRAPELDAQFSLVQRLRFIKRAKALRAVEIPVGIFGHFSLDVPVIMWEEILNQLLFVLTF